MSSRFLFWGVSLIAALAAAAACSDSASPAPSGVSGTGASTQADGASDQSSSGGSGGSIAIDAASDTNADATCDLDADDCVFEVPDAGPFCGDGIVNQATEACDDGNLLPGDGCTGVCETEPNATCPPTGGPCTSNVACGDGTRSPGEACDDKNNTPGDGCAADCTAVDPGWYCPTPGQACVKLANCGDSRLQPGETCDDGARIPDDGCSADCRVEPGYRCIKPGSPCEQIPICGDGKVEGAEDCDDGDTTAGDGCSSACRKEASYYDCPPAGGECVKTVSCGDGKVEDTEKCDDGNKTNFDGCSAACFVDSGWKCPVPNQKCVPDCGDGKKLSIEECDDGNRTTGDGCTSTCRIEPGYVCATVGTLCKKAVCGDGKLEGTELCDEGAQNGLFTGDPNNLGCSQSCTPEPRCRDSNGTTRACTSTCGDGMRLGSEQCDDGNLSNGDGCSTLCATESGFTCSNVTSSATKPCTTGSAQCLFLPIVYRDFHGMQMKDGSAHPDFFYVDPARPNVSTVEGTVQMPGCVQDQLCLGLVQNALDGQGKPLRAKSGSDCQTCSYGSNPNPYMIYSVSSFDSWFRDEAGTNQPTSSTIELQPIAGGQFRFERRKPSGLFPLDGLEWGGETRVCQQWPYWDKNPTSCGTTHNYHFTSEVRYLFPYRGGESLTFLGDDDVWVFVNGRLVVDLGGTHQEQTGSITINAGNQASYAMAPNNLYEIVVFHADRHPIDSNYQLTLSGFQTERSACVPTCGDGVATVFEECDNGPANSDTAYGGCRKNCSFGPRCGDGTKDAQEQCDDGKNTTTGYGASGCAPGCKLPPRCGDATLDLGEECDRGAQNSDNAYDGCTTSCTLGPYCGDGIAQPAFQEECDDGLNIGGYGQCGAGCKWGERCGDGVPQPGEICDDGADNGKPGKCTSDCGLPGVCGDGIVQSGEECDNGVNDNSYGGCSIDCRYGPRCGDGVVHASHGEQCDLGGSNKDGLYGGCSKTCRYGPHCGDGVVQQGTTEQCDDGDNQSGDGCSAACLTEIHVPK
jgi:fibro-slime domain-containing protein